MLTAMTWAAAGVAWFRLANVRARRLPLSRTAPPVRSPSRFQIEGRIGRGLDRAEVRLAPVDAVKLWVAAVLAVAALGLAVSGLTTALVGAAGALAAAPTALWLRRDRRALRLRADMPGLLDEVTRELRVGGTVGSALARCEGKEGPLGAEATSIVNRTRLGVGLHDALASWAEAHGGTPAGRVAATVGAGLRVAAGTGGRAAGPLDALAAAMREEEAAVAEATAQAAQGRLSAVLLAALPVVSLSLSAVADPASVSALVVHPLGRLVFAAGVALEVLGMAWMRRILRTVS